MRLCLSSLTYDFQGPTSEETENSRLLVGYGGLVVVLVVDRRLVIGMML